MNLSRSPTLSAATTGVLAAMMFTASSANSRAAEEFALPPETARYVAAPGGELATTFCLTCHSADYISTQPPLTRAQWTASVGKMKKTYGAPVPDDQVDRLVEYLVKNYGDEKPGR